MGDASTTTGPSSLPANYVTILELKERWLEKERQQNEKERQQLEEELRQQKLREEEVQKPSKPKSIAVVPKTEPDPKPKGRNYRAKYRPANPSVSEGQCVELEEKKSEEPAEENKAKEKKYKKKKKKVRAEMEKEGIADAPPQASGEKGSDEAKGNIETGIEIEIRAKSEDVKVVQKSRHLSVNSEAGKGDHNSRRPSKVDRRSNGEIRGKSEKLGLAVEVLQKLGGLSVDVEAGKGDENLSRPTKVDWRGNGEIRGYRKFGRSDGPKRDSGMVWVKKGEVADVNGGGVRSSEESGGVSGQSGTSSNAGSLASAAGKMSKNHRTRRHSDAVFIL